MTTRTMLWLTTRTLIVTLCAYKLVLMRRLSKLRRVNREMLDRLKQVDP